MNSIIFICGIFNLGFAIFHMFFWKIFNWKEDLKSLTFANRAIIQIFNMLGIYYFLFSAVICFMYPSEILTSQAGSIFLLFNALFWAIRTVLQFFYLRVNNIYINTLTALFILGTFLFLWPLLG